MTLVIFKRRQGWYWRLVAKNGRVLAIGAEPFYSAKNARRSFNDLHAGLTISHSPTVPHKRVPISARPVAVINQGGRP